MIPVLIWALISLSVAETDLDVLYPELEHSRTIYVTGECLCLCVLLFFDLFCSVARFLFISSLILQL